MTPQEQQREWNKNRWNIQNYGVPCSLNQPMGLVVPPEGIIIQCLAHPEGHFLRPSLDIWC